MFCDCCCLAKQLSHKSMHIKCDLFISTAQQQQHQQHQQQQQQHLQQNQQQKQQLPAITLYNAAAYLDKHKNPQRALSLGDPCRGPHTHTISQSVSQPVIHPIHSVPHHIAVQHIPYSIQHTIHPSIRCGLIHKHSAQSLPPTFAYFCMRNAIYS